MIHYRISAEEAVFQRFPSAFDGLDWETARNIYFEARAMTNTDDEITESILHDARRRMEIRNA